ncbi:MAG: fibronectin type III domain-containing protein [Candidatus Competibacteraceae bacterium]|nr:fibronectin type III domain-containing protein [Candidatus Competibacteraceae bacterium]
MFDFAIIMRGLMTASIVLLLHSTNIVFAREVTLAWNANPEPVLGGYRLYYGTSTGNYTSVVEVGNQTTYTVFGLADDRPYYFVVTAYDSTKTVESGFSNEVFLAPSTLRAAQESPSEGSYESGIGLIRGWVCDASTVEVEIDGKRYPTAHGTLRGDTATACGTANNGYGLTFNWNSLRDGPHTLRALADGVEFANVAFQVTTLGTDFLRDAPQRDYVLSDFPRPGDSVTVRWSEAQQNFMIVGTSIKKDVANQRNITATQHPFKSFHAAHQESPSEGSYESGIGLIRGWVCGASTVEVEIDGGARYTTAYGTPRGDTAAACDTTNTGYGLTFNWNALGDGPHTLRALADGVEFANVAFQVTTLGTDFLRGAPQRDYVLSDFPRPGDRVTVRWSEAQQNFTIVRFDSR